MTTGLSYSGSSTTMSYIQQIAEMAVVDQTDANYLAILPAMVTYAENRMYRDLDFLFTSTSVTGYTITNGSRSTSSRLPGKSTPTLALETLFCPRQKSI